MGREVRRVPANWEHPKKENGEYIPLLGGNFAERLAQWEEGKRKWDEGFRETWGDGEKWIPRTPDENGTYEDWDGERPVESEYMPQWPEAEKTHLQMYQNTSEGTPISPVMETPEELARWLVDNNASAFGGQTASYEGWLSTIKRGWAPGGIWTPQTGMLTGVDGLKDN